jgi:hypothetical protein
MPSRAIRAFVYDETRNELTVGFPRGRTYLYSLVPAAVAEAFAASPTKGAFHNELIRDRYPFRRIKPDAAASASFALRELLSASVEAEGEETGAAATPASDRNAPQDDGSRRRG